MNRGNDWDVQREKAIKRDNHICRICGIKATNVHHIIPYRKTQDNSLINLITLCNKCHKQTENNYIRLGETRTLRNMIKENIERVKR